MTLQEKYDKLRAAVVEMTGVDDDPVMQQQMADVLAAYNANADPDIAATRNVLLALIETH